MPKLSHPVNPGVNRIDLSNKYSDNQTAKTVGFIGNEWKRKTGKSNIHLANA